MKVTYSLPTANEDGTALLPDDIKQIDVLMEGADGFAVVASDVTPQDGMVEVDISLAPGTHRFALRTVNRWGKVSKLSEIATKVVEAPTPKAPFGVALG